MKNIVRISALVLLFGVLMGLRYAVSGTLLRTIVACAAGAIAGVMLVIAQKMPK